MHDLKAQEMLERERMRDFIALLLAAHADGRSEAELNTVEVEALQGLIAGANDRPATWISNVLCFHYQICRSPLTGGETGGPKANRQPTHVQRMNGMDGILTMHPNPASTWAAFNYDLLEAPVDARIVIRDVAGREVHRLALTERKQQVLWDTREVVPGSYTVTLMNAGRGLRSEPLIVRP